jgi:hypothetical protein
MSGEDDDRDDGGEMRCGYCGKWIYADSPCCPKCGNYTDGLGRFQRPEKDGRTIPGMYVAAGWLVVLAFVAPLLIALVQWMRK